MQLATYCVVVTEVVVRVGLSSGAVLVKCGQKQHLQHFGQWSLPVYALGAEAGSGLQSAALDVLLRVGSKGAAASCRFGASPRPPLLELLTCAAAGKEPVQSRQKRFSCKHDSYCLVYSAGVLSLGVCVLALTHT